MKTVCTKKTVKTYCCSWDCWLLSSFFFSILFDFSSFSTFFCLLELCVMCIDIIKLVLLLLCVVCVDLLKKCVICCRRFCFVNTFCVVFVSLYFSFWINEHIKGDCVESFSFLCWCLHSFHFLLFSLGLKKKKGIRKTLFFNDHAFRKCRTRDNILQNPINLL